VPVCNWYRTELEIERTTVEKLWFVFLYKANLGSLYEMVNGGKDAFLVRVGNTSFTIS